MDTNVHSTQIQILFSFHLQFFDAVSRLSISRRPNKTIIHIMVKYVFLLKVHSLSVVEYILDAALKVSVLNVMNIKETIFYSCLERGVPVYLHTPYRVSVLFPNFEICSQ